VVTSATGSPAAEESALRDRIVRAIREEATLLAAGGIATEDDIALALRLGAGHPGSPFG
jgi:NAD(P)H-dependent flavin oxidoreductase YrpB (nitropropane dioxygenase family)